MSNQQLENIKTYLKFVAILVIFLVYHKTLQWWVDSKKRKRPLLIAFTGEAGSGKDTACSFLEPTNQFAFAAPLKRMLGDTFGFTWEQMYVPEEKEKVHEVWGICFRECAQWMGTDVLRGRWRDFFTRRMGMEIDNALKYDPNAFIVITDARFDNEAEFIRERGGFILKIERTNNHKKTAHATHASEQGISAHLIDGVITNNGTSLFEFKAAVLVAVENLYNKDN